MPRYGENTVTEEEQVLIDNVRGTENLLADHKQKLFDYRIANHPLKVGDVVRLKDGEIVRIAQFRREFGDTPRAIAARQKKDGTFGNSLKTLYTSDKPVKIEAEKANA
jgi:hypothetical protein